MAGTILGLLITAVTFILKFVKSAKARKSAEGIIEIGNVLLSYMEEAETFIKYGGQAKKEYVLTKAKQFALEHDMEFDAEWISAEIEELISLTKTVNKRQKDKLCAGASRQAQQIQNQKQGI